MKTTLFWLFALVVATPAGVWGRDYYVAPDGDDGQPGTKEAPLRTIQKAADVARAGDAVLVRAGVYIENVVLRFSGEPHTPIVLKNYPDERPVLDGAGRGAIVLSCKEGYRKPIGWITIEGFEVRNGWDGIKYYNAHDIALRGNHIHDCANQGILGAGHHVLIEGNTIARNGSKPNNQTSNQEHGIYATGTHITIVNNVVHSNKAYGIQVAGYEYTPKKHAGPEFAGAKNWLVSHNTVAFQQNRAGIGLWQAETTDCIVQNNILYQNATNMRDGTNQGIDMVTAGGGNVIRRNLFFAPQRTSIVRKPTSSTVTDSLEINPQFVDAERFDFHLLPGSPAIDAGAAENAVATDLDGTSRPQGSGFDIGAYEYREKSTKTE